MASQTNASSEEKTEKVQPLPDDICSLLRKGSGCSESELSDLERLLLAQTIPTLRALSRRFRVKRSSNARKAVLVGKLLSYCELGLTKDGEGNGSDDEEIVDADSARQPDVRHTTAAERQQLLSLPDQSSSPCRKGGAKICQACRSLPSWTSSPILWNREKTRSTKNRSRRTIV